MTEAFLKAIDTGDLPALAPEQRASAKPIAALGQAGATQFYRLSGFTAKITDIRLANGKVILSYE